MRRTVQISVAQRRWSELLGVVTYRGETVYLTRWGRPCAMIVRVESALAISPRGVETIVLSSRAAGRQVCGLARAPTPTTIETRSGPVILIPLHTVGRLNRHHGVS